MAEPDTENPEVARGRLLELFEADEWDLSDRALHEGAIALRWLYDRKPTRWEMVAHVISLLKSDIPLRCAPQGDPPGSTGIAWQITDSRNVFVKLRIREHRLGEEYAYIQSLHESIHRK